MKPKTVGRIEGKPLETRRVESVNGLTPCTQILTLDGSLPVEVLAAGDKIITRNAGLVTLKGLICATVACETVRIQAGSLGRDRPDSDTVLPADQQVLIRDWRAKALFGASEAHVPLRRLVDGEFVQLQPKAGHMIFKLIFESPQVIYADGLELECATHRVMVD